METLNEIISIIKDTNTITILPHIHADGDALGSSLGLALALEKLHKNVSIYLEEEIPSMYDFLPGRDFIATYRGEGINSELVIALDTGDRDRLGKRVNIFDMAKKTVNIDHHRTNTMFAQENYVDSQSAAVGEIVYHMIKMLNVEIDLDMAICLYTAISTDTGGFKYSNTTSQTHIIISELLKHKIPVSDISDRVFDSTSYEKVKLIGLAADSLKLFEEGKIALIMITDEMMSAAKAKDEDYDGIVNLGRNIRGVEVSILLKEINDNEIKGNLRSKNYVDVAAIAAKYSGGGHKRASGFSVCGKLTDVAESLINDIKKEL